MSGEEVQNFMSKVSFVVNQMRGFGDNVANHVVVAKILRSLTPKFDYIVAAIEEAKDLTKLSMDGLNDSLQAYEARIN